MLGNMEMVAGVSNLMIAYPGQAPLPHVGPIEAASQWFCKQVIGLKSDEYKSYSGKTFTAIVSHVESPDCVWLQLEDNYNKAEAQIVEFNHFYTQPNLQLAFGKHEQLATGHYCAAMSSIFNNWYRALVQKINPATNSATVLFIDFGFREECSLECLKPLTRPLVGTNQALAMKVNLLLEKKMDVDDDAVVNVILDFSERKRLFVSLTYKNELLYASIKADLTDDLLNKGLAIPKQYLQ